MLVLPLFYTQGNRSKDHSNGLLRHTVSKQQIQDLNQCNVPATAPYCCSDFKDCVIQDKSPAGFLTPRTLSTQGNKFKSCACVCVGMGVEWGVTFACECQGSRTHASKCMQRPEQTLGVFLSHSALYSLRQDVSLNQKLATLVRLAGSESLGSSCCPPTPAQFLSYRHLQPHMAFMCRNSNSGPHISTACGLPP